MKINLILLLLLLIAGKVTGQISIECKKFVTSFFKDNYQKKDTFLFVKGWEKGAKKEVLLSLKATIGNDTLRQWMRIDNERKLIDSFIFLKAEKDLIANTLERQIDTSLWNCFKIPNSRFISQDSISNIFRGKGINAGWWYFHEHYGKRYHHFSVPILFRGNTLCAFYESYSCGGECGQGNFSIYRMINKKWEHWFSFYQWES